MKSMAYIVLQTYAYDNVLVTKYFCMTTNLWCSYICAYSDLSNPEGVWLKITDLLVFFLWLVNSLKNL